MQRPIGCPSGKVNIFGGVVRSLGSFQISRRFQPYGPDLYIAILGVLCRTGTQEIVSTEAGILPTRAFFEATEGHRLGFSPPGQSKDFRRIHSSQRVLRS